MLNTTNTIKLKTNTAEQIIEANEVVFGHERIGGKLEETTDGLLVENYTKERLTIEVEFIADGTLSGWLLDTWLVDDNKYFVCDGMQYNVVVASNKTVFALLKNKNYRAKITLKLKKKEIGLTGTEEAPA